MRLKDSAALVVLAAFVLLPHPAGAAPPLPHGGEIRVSLLENVTTAIRRSLSFRTADLWSSGPSDHSLPRAVLRSTPGSSVGTGRRPAASSNWSAGLAIRNSQIMWWLIATEASSSPGPKRRRRRAISSCAASTATARRRQAHPGQRAQQIEPVQGRARRRRGRPLRSGLACVGRSETVQGVTPTPSPGSSAPRETR